MKITLEPTHKVGADADHPTISIAIPGDSHSLPFIFQSLIIPALKAYGFSEEVINSTLNEGADV